MHYIGIDVSKAKLDFALLDGHGKVVDQAETKNTTAGVTAQIKRWARMTKSDSRSWLVCLEPTGHYSHNVVATLLHLKVPTWVAHPLDLKRSMGMVRGKNDRIDAVRIADYAMRHRDKKREVGARTLAVLELKQLLAFRERLVVDCGRHGMHNTDVYPCTAQPLRTVFRQYSKRCIISIKAMVKKVDRLIVEHITKDPDMHQQYKLLLSVERVGPVLAAHLLAATECFGRMPNGRQLACHAGVAPHDHTSGSSIHHRARVSHHADKRLKCLLHMAALGVLQRDTELTTYYRRKLADGKNAMCVLNAVRNKLVHRICAVIKRGTPYVVRPAINTEPSTTMSINKPLAQAVPVSNFAHRAKRKRALLESNPPGINPTNDGLRPRARSTNRSLPKPGVPHASENSHTTLAHVIE